MLFCTAGAVPLMAHDPLLPAVRRLAEKAFAQKTEEAIRQTFKTGLAALTEPQARCQALALLAEYERHIGNYQAASGFYRQAAALCKPTNTMLLLEAVKTLLGSGDFETAASLLNTILTDIPHNDADPLYRTAAVYETWRLLAQDRSDLALPVIRSYLQKKAFSDYHPALLFTLWWTASDETAKQRLLKEFPAAIETAAVQGNVTVLPSQFWYLMPKTVEETNVYTASKILNSEAHHAAAQAATDASRHEKQTKPLYYQLGFYRTKKYAENFAENLRKKNFTPLIKEEKRPSGTVYFAVLVEENTLGDMGLRLKDAGYEAFPIFP